MHKPTSSNTIPAREVTKSMNRDEQRLHQIQILLHAYNNGRYDDEVKKLEQERDEILQRLDVINDGNI